MKGLIASLFFNKHECSWYRLRIRDAQAVHEQCSPGPIIDDDAQLKGLIGSILNNYERSLKGSKLATIGLALSDDRAMWNVSLLKSIGELIKASLYYNELLLRKLNTIQEELSKARNNLERPGDI